ncbi:MAG: triosephosphate isomerase, partial [Lentisphaerae bacterium]|nr:triosephosphate isomerase [Lentisphaerota bacterium]
MSKKTRRPIVAGNWKMHKTSAEAEEFIKSLIKMQASMNTGVDVVVCPPFTALSAVSGLLEESQIRLGAQNMHWEKNGAFTGEISAGMLRAIYCHYVILGHSERRTLFGETDTMVNLKVKTALQSHLKPILCVGETLEEREAGEMRSVIKRQVER